MRGTCVLHFANVTDATRAWVHLTYGPDVVAEDGRNFLLHRSLFKQDILAALKATGQPASMKNSQFVEWPLDDGRRFSRASGRWQARR